jgi:hypothetical protein
MGGTETGALVLDRWRGERGSLRGGGTAEPGRASAFGAAGPAVAGAMVHHGDRLAEVDRLGRALEDLAGVAQVRVDVAGRAARSAAEQGAGMRQDHRVVIDVGDPRLGGNGLGDLMGVTRRGDAGADVEELADSPLPGQVAHGASEEGAVGADRGDQAGERLQGLFAGGPVSGEVVFAEIETCQHTCEARQVADCAHKWTVRYSVNSRQRE